jgi:hypothetical protein
MSAVIVYIPKTPQSDIFHDYNIFSIFSTDVKVVPLYACETWKVTQKITKRLPVFINRCLRRIINIRWPETI